MQSEYKFITFNIEKVHVSFENLHNVFSRELFLVLSSGPVADFRRLFIHLFNNLTAIFFNELRLLNYTLRNKYEKM